MASRMLSLDFEKTWRIIDFQTGGPTVSPLLLIYMCWKSNMIPMGEPDLSVLQSIPNFSPPWLVHLYISMRHGSTQCSSDVDPWGCLVTGMTNSHPTHAT